MFSLVQSGWEMLLDPRSWFAELLIGSVFGVAALTVWWPIGSAMQLLARVIEARSNRIVVAALVGALVSGLPVAHFWPGGPWLLLAAGGAAGGLVAAMRVEARE